MITTNVNNLIGGMRSQTKFCVENDLPCVNHLLFESNVSSRQIRDYFIRKRENNEGYTGVRYYVDVLFTGN